MKTIKKTLALILAVAMVTISIPITISADEDDLRTLQLMVLRLLGHDLIVAESLYEASQNDWIMTLTDSLSERFREIVVEIYPDVSNVDEWYNDYVILPSHFEVFQWDDRGLRPNDTVTAAEAVRAIATAFEGELEPDGEDWYEPYYDAIEQTFPYGRDEMNEEYMARPITRAEMAYVLAKILDDGSLNSYSENLEIMGVFEDFTNIADIETQNWKTECKYMDEGKIPLRFAGAIAYLYDKGIMTGDGHGHINPLAPVTRAEVLTLIQKACQADCGYTKGKFRIH